MSDNPYMFCRLSIVTMLFVPLDGSTIGWILFATRFLSALFPLHQVLRGVMVPNPKDLIKVYEKKSPFTGLHTRLLTKLSPKVVQGINKIFTHCK